MKNFYSIIYLVGNKASDEKVSIGMLGGSDEKPIFEFSEKKLKKALSLVDSDIDSNIKNLLGNFKKKVEDHNSKEKKSPLLKSDNWPFNLSRVNYLSKSADGIIEFSKPKFPNEDLSRERFINLFRLLVDNNFLLNEKIYEINNHFKEDVNELKRAPIVKERADINFRADNNLFSTIYDEAKIDLLSVNGRILSGNAIDFSMSLETIEKHLYLFRAISEGVIKFSKKKDLKDEPWNVLLFNSIKDKQKEKVLNSVHREKDKPFDLLEIDELDKVKEELASSDYQKFSEKFL